MASPCIDVCRYDETTGWCLGCGMSKPEKRRWKKGDKEDRAELRTALPDRLLALAAAGHPTGKEAKRRKRDKHRKE